MKLWRMHHFGWIYCKFRLENGENYILILPMNIKQMISPDQTVWNKSKMAAVGTLCIIEYRVKAISLKL